MYLPSIEGESMSYELNNTIYITLDNAHLRLSNENLVIEHPDSSLRYVPLHHLEAIVLLGNIQVSTPLIAYCATRGIALVWMDAYGRFRGRLEGVENGSVMLRRAQHLALSDPERTLSLARQFITGKIQNQIQVLSRHIRNHPETAERLGQAVEQIQGYLEQVPNTRTLDDLRGVEGGASRVYFGHFDLLIRTQREAFRFQGRNRRPRKTARTRCSRSSTPSTARNTVARCTLSDSTTRWATCTPCAPDAPPSP